MVKDWSLKSKAKAVLPKPLWSNPLTKAIAKSSTYVVLSGRNKKKIAKPDISVEEITDETSIESNDIQIPPCINALQQGNIYESEVINSTECKPIIKHQAQKIKIKNVYHFVNFRYDYIFTKNCDKEKSFVSCVENITPIKVEESNTYMLGDFFQYINELQEQSNVTKTKSIPSLTKLPDVKEVYPEYFIDYHEYIKHLNIQIESNESLISFKNSLERLSQIDIDQDKDTKLGDYFTGIAEVENESTSEILIVPLVASIDNIFNDITDSNAPQDNQITYLPISESIIWNTNSYDEINSNSDENIEIKQEIQLCKDLLNVNSEEDASQTHDMNNMNVSKLSSSKSILNDVFKYVHESNGKPLKNKVLDDNTLLRKSSFLDNMSCPKENSPLERKINGINENKLLFDSTSLIYSSFSMTPVISNPSFYTTNNGVYFLDTNKVKKSIDQVRDQIKEFTMLEKRLTSYYEFLINQQSNA
uniref:Cytadherence-associated protein n=1 Tax=Parastrongyloides trichosuri TaxID=131310 RepID=A0A0N4ZT42_PARTI